MSERRSTASRVHAAREAKGLSLRRAARRLGVSVRALRGWERGREPIPYAVRLSMVDLYGIAREEIAPDRPARAEHDATNQTIRIGNGAFEIRLRSWRTAERNARSDSSSAPAARNVSDPIRIVWFVASCSARAGRSGAISSRAIP
jgi:transcriptional regulator with XRE-family HTH domain